MADSKPNATETRLPERSEEARNLAKEGVEERRHGNTEESDFLINEAKQLDQQAAQAVLKENKA
jgi:hypothetical protein